MNKIIKTIGAHKIFILILGCLSLSTYFLYSYEFIRYSLGLHPDNINNLNLHVMIAKGYHPLEASFTFFRSRELYDFNSAVYVLVSYIYRLFESPVAALAFINYCSALLSFSALFFVVKKYFDFKTALLTLITTVLSVWMVVIFRTNFFAYVILCFFSIAVLYLYWQAISEKSYKYLILLCITGIASFFMTTWPIFLVFIFIFLYSIVDGDSRRFVFSFKGIVILLIIPAVSLILISFSCRRCVPLSDTFINYYSYFVVRRLPEHGGGVKGISLIEHLSLFFKMITDYYEALCVLWGHPRVKESPIQLMNPVFMLTGILGTGVCLFSKKRIERFYAWYCLFCLLALSLFFVPNERYFVIVVPFIFVMSSVFILRIVNYFSLEEGKRNIIFGILISIFILMGLFNIKNNYLTYNKIINSYLLGGADRRRHGIEEDRSFLAQKVEECDQLYVSYNVSDFQIDIENYYGINYSGKMHKTDVGRFVNVLQNQNRLVKNEEGCYAFILSRFLPNADRLETFFTSKGIVPAEKLHDITGLNYKNIYYFK